MDRADLEARLVELEQEYDRERLQAAAVDGAIQQVRWTLEHWDDEKPLKVVKDEEVDHG